MRTSRKTESYSVADRADWLRGDPRTCSWRPIGTDPTPTDWRYQVELVAVGWLVTVGIIGLLAIVMELALR